MPGFVYKVLISPLGQAAWKVLRDKLWVAKKPARVVVCVPSIAAQCELTGIFFEWCEAVKTGLAESAVLVVDVDALGFVSVQTSFPTKDLPKDAGKTAGDRDCFWVQGTDTLYVYDTGKGKVRPEVLGGTTIYDGDETFRTKK